MPRKRVSAMPSPLRSVDWSRVSLGKLLILVSIAIAALIVLFWMFGSLAQSLSSMRTGGDSISVMPREGKPYPAMGMPGMAEAPVYDGSYGGTGGMGVPSLSYRNTMPPMPVPGHVPGTDAEAFETSDYQATITRADITPACAAIEALKRRSDVIFEHSERGDRYCSYRFKVAKPAKDAVLGAVEALRPEELQVQTMTLKNQIVDYTDTLSILQTKLTAIEAALTEAQESYESLSDFAVSQGDAETLARVIDSKIALIDRLSQERLMVAAEIDRMNRAKQNELERVEYVFFTVSAHADPVFDGKALGESWKQAFKELLAGLNSMLQAVTVGLVTFLLLIAQIALYGLILLIGVKFGIRIVRRIWDW